MFAVLISERSLALNQAIAAGCQPASLRVQVPDRAVEAATISFVKHCTLLAWCCSIQLRIAVLCFCFQGLHGRMWYSQRFFMWMQCAQCTVKAGLSSECHFLIMHFAECRISFARDNRKFFYETYAYQDLETAPNSTKRAFTWILGAKDLFLVERANDRRLLREILASASWRKAQEYVWISCAFLSEISLQFLEFLCTDWMELCKADMLRMKGSKIWKQKMKICQS